MKKSIILFLVLNACQIFAQKSTSGEIVYRKSIEFSQPKQNDMVYNSELKSIFSSLDIMRYTLKFNKEASYFGLDKMMDSDLKKLNRKALTKGKGKWDFYTNIKNNESVQIVEKDGKTFFVETVKPTFKLLNETKNISGYICYKATTTEVEYLSKLNKELSKYKTNLEDKENHIVAWYTKDIAVPFGPLNFFGLPGVVLELQYADTKYTAVKINLKSNNLNIVAPIKGKFVSKQEYDEMMLEGLKNIGN